MPDKFEDFINQQIKSVQKNDEGTLDIEEEKKLWLEMIDKFYKLVQASLDDYLKKGVIKLDYRTMTLTEEQLGSYEVKEANIFMGSTRVKLKPIGTFLIGARGRIDMLGPRGNARFVIVPPDASAPKMTVTTRIAGELVSKSEEKKYVPPKDWVWKITTPPPRITYVDLTGESFKTTLMEVVNG